jgi:hypothetical protein
MRMRASLILVLLLAGMQFLYDKNEFLAKTQDAGKIQRPGPRSLRKYSGTSISSPGFRG